MDILDIKTLADRTISDGDYETSIAYLLEKKEGPPEPNQVNRIAGSPIGVTDENWPTFNKHKMHHVITLDLETTPILQKHFPKEINAVALFISDFINHEAFTPGTKHAEIVFLNSSDLANGVNDNNPIKCNDYRMPVEGSFTCHELELPIILFDNQIDENHPTKFLFDSIENYSIAAGHPIWLQTPDHDGQILLQFDEFFIDMNLGDAGMMYVFKDTAFTQSH